MLSNPAGVVTLHELLEISERAEAKIQGAHRMLTELDKAKRISDEKAQIFERVRSVSQDEALWTSNQRRQVEVSFSDNV